jgi:hypothetical protein
VTSNKPVHAGLENGPDRTCAHARQVGPHHGQPECFLMDPISIGAQIIGMITKQTACRSCGQQCDGGGWVCQAWVTPCCKWRVCETCIQHWAAGVQRHNGRCPKCNKPAR